MTLDGVDVGFEVEAPGQDEAVEGGAGRADQQKRDPARGARR